MGGGFPFALLEIKKVQSIFASFDCQMEIHAMTEFKFKIMLINTIALTATMTMTMTMLG